jgi:hypothetical protein
MLVRFYAFTVMIIKITVALYVTPCSLVVKVSDVPPASVFTYP